MGKERVFAPPTVTAPTTRHKKRGAWANQEQDDELFDLIGAIGAGISVAKDEEPPPAARLLGMYVAEDSAAKLADIKRRGQMQARTPDPAQTPADRHQSAYLPTPTDWLCR
ncbi:hypothetical protein [Streptomyces sp. NBC_00280]|uniref:hypothetical protein n=1 Tax=Streptomyces sp. NBC_00280 TaxID=2975699 RepID=UPI00324E8D3F